MKRLRVLQLTLLCCLYAPSAHAYLDPGTGSLILQLIIGALAAASLFFKTFWLRIKSFFGLLGGSSTSNTNLPTHSAPLHSSTEIPSRKQKAPSDSSTSS